jgi:hypothetical protein
MATGSWYDWLPAIVQGGATLWGAQKASNANVTAARIAADATNRATAAQIAQQEEARKVLAANQAAASPGLTAMQSQIARGPRLTPLQQQNIADARQQTVASISPGLRGSGAATVAAVRKVEDNLTRGYMDSNQTAADRAAQSLSGQYFNAGTNTAQSLSNSGQTLASGLTAIGDINANQYTKSADTTGKAIGDIGAIIADQYRELNRPKAADQKLGEK